jgi:hypothetical protein
MDEQNKIDLFLKKNAPEAPAAPFGEKQRIWRAIEAEANQGAWWKFSFAQFRIAVPALAALAIVASVSLHHKHKRDLEVERILSTALAYQIEELEEPPSMF